MNTSSTKLVVLTPYTASIDPGCEQGLAALERRGYVVRRVPGFSAIDFGRTVLANNALADGFEEILWIDSDIVFDPDDVEKLRNHQLPIAVAVCPKKGLRQFTCHFPAGTQKVVFGVGGGLHPCLLRAFAGALDEPLQFVEALFHGFLSLGGHRALAGIAKKVRRLTAQYSTITLAEKITGEFF